MVENFTEKIAENLDFVEYNNFVWWNTEATAWSCSGVGCSEKTEIAKNRPVKNNWEKALEKTAVDVKEKIISIFDTEKGKKCNCRQHKRRLLQVKIHNAFDHNYIEYESRGDKSKTLSTEENPEKLDGS